MKKIIIIPLILFVSSVFAQGVFKFEEESYDFGTIKEGVVATHVFKFKNIGKEPIIITSVNASCGCTTPSWTTTPILPNATGEIKASYNSQGRPGAFAKTITVTSNALTESKVLRINGVVEKAFDDQISKEQFEKSPIVSITDFQFNFGNVELGKMVSHKFEITNTGKSDLNVRNITSGCNCVTYTMDKPTLKPGEKGYINLIYKPRTLGTQKEYVTLLSNDVSRVESPAKMLLKAEVIKDAATKTIVENDDKITF